MLAHEVKNPLSGIRGAAQLLEQDADPAGRELTQLICDESDRIVALVDRMELFSDHPPIEREPLNIHRVLERVRKDLERIVAADRTSKPLPADTTAADPASKSPDLAAARQYLTQQRRLPAARVKQMPPAQVLVLVVLGVLIVATHPQWFLFVLFSLYLLSGPGRLVWMRLRSEQVQVVEKSA